LPTIDTATLKIIRYPDPRLRKVCEPVTRFDDSLRALAVRMLELMHEAKGVGLAAPQLGVLTQMFVCLSMTDPKENMILVNPELTDLRGQIAGDEGCLSIPDVTVEIRRAASCTILAQDLYGEPIRATGVDLVARCWQHECDHLNGRLITDRMSEAEKIANRRALKALEAEFKG
jgi:peptide deformylase